jgi:superfamily II DNA or RNA helicase
MNLLKDPNRMNVILGLIKKCMNDTSIKKIILMAQFRNIIDMLYKSIDNESDVGIFYSVTSKKEKIKQAETLKNKKLILAVSALGKESLNIVDCNCLILITPPLIHRNSKGEWNCQQMDQAVGRCLRRNWESEFCPKIYIINDMFSFFLNHYRKRKIYFHDIRKDPIHTLDQNTLIKSSVIEEDQCINNICKYKKELLYNDPVDIKYYPDSQSYLKQK